MTFQPAPELVKRYVQANSEYAKKLNELNHQARENVRYFLKQIGFHQVEDAMFEVWKRKKDKITETIVVGHHYFGIFYQGDDTTEMVKHIQINLGTTITTFNEYGVGAKSTEYEPIDVYEFLWDYLGDDYEKLKEVKE